MKVLVLASALILVACGGGDKPDIDFVPSDGRPRDSAADLPSAEILSGSSTPPPAAWSLTQFPNLTKRQYGAPALSASGAVAVLGCEDSSLTLNCLVYAAAPSTASFVALPPFAGKPRAVNGKTVLLSDKGTVVVNTDAGAAKSNLAGTAFVPVASAQTTVYALNDTDDFVGRDGTVGEFYISNLSSPATKATLQALGSQRVTDVIDLNAAGQVVGTLERPANSVGPAYYLATATSMKSLNGVALQYSSTDRPLGVVTSLNDVGQLAGYYSSTRLSFVSKPGAEGVVGSVDATKGAFTACCINKKGQLAGTSSLYTGGVLVELKSVTAFQAAGLSELALSDINDRVQLVGLSTGKSGEKVVVLFSPN